jgi:hypothetical protein
MSAIKGIGKITAKAVIGAKLAEIMQKKMTATAKNEAFTFERFEAMRIQGRVDKCVVKPSSLNPDNIDVKLTGEFIATNLESGEVFQSGSLYPMGTGMADLMATAKPGSMFALRVFLAPSAKTIQGYSFDFETAMEIKPDEAVQRLGDAFLSLPAPAKKAEHENKGKEATKK